MDKNGNMPVYVLPLDPVRSKIRNFAQTIFYSSVLFYILSDLDIIPYELKKYNSIKEREEAFRSGKKPKKLFSEFECPNFSLLDAGFEQIWPENRIPREKLCIMTAGKALSSPLRDS